MNTPEQHPTPVPLADSESFKDLCTRHPEHSVGWQDRICQWLHKMAAGSPLPAKWVYPELRQLADAVATDDQNSSDSSKSSKSNSTNKNTSNSMHLEIVSHCWNYSDYLAFQLGSLVAHPPMPNLHVTMTVFHTTDDKQTSALLKRIEQLSVPNITWNWQALPAAYLFRRSIGRNLAALHTQADWIWFTDCDETFQAGCLSGLQQALLACRDPLVFPLTEYRTEPMESSSLKIDYDADWISKITDLPLDEFHANGMTRATGPLQITRGDIARQFGYCKDIDCFQKPEVHFAKAHEDRIYRWLLNTNGTGVDIPGVFRIQHREKGRERNARWLSSIRESLRHARYKRLRKSTRP